MVEGHDPEDLVAAYERDDEDRAHPEGVRHLGREGPFPHEGGELLFEDPVRERTDILLPDHEPLEDRVPLPVRAEHLRGPELPLPPVEQEDGTSVHADELRGDPHDGSEDLLEVREACHHLRDPEEGGKDLLVPEFSFW